jgi:SAM-dependent methyltransferase
MPKTPRSFGAEEAGIADILVCPRCLDVLQWTTGQWHCAVCGCQGTIDDGIAHFVKEFQWRGDLPIEQIRELTNVAAKIGWRDAVAKSPHPEVRWAAESVCDINTVNWQWLLRLPSASRVLDLGAGMGADAHGLALQYQEIVALEPVLERARFMRQRFMDEGLSNVKIVRSSAMPLPFAADSFDMVLLKEPLEHVVADRACNQNGLYSVAESVWRVLRPGGIFCLGVDNRFAVASLLERLCGRSKKPRRLCSRRRYGALLRQAGFSVADCYLALPSCQQPRFLVPFEQRVWSYYSKTFGTGSQTGLRGLAREMLVRSRLLQSTEQSFVFIAIK